MDNEMKIISTDILALKKESIPNFSSVWQALSMENVMTLSKVTTDTPTAVMTIPNTNINTLTI